MISFLSLLFVVTAVKRQSGEKKKNGGVMKKREKGCYSSVDPHFVECP